MSPTRTIIKNAMANGAGFACEAVISFCMLPFILHRIGESAYGVWAFTIAVSGYMGILNLGFRPAINKYVAQYNATGEWQKIRDLLQASLFSYSICAILMLATCSGIALNIDSLFNIPPEYHYTVTMLVLLVGIQMATGLLAVVYGGVISGLQRYEINNGIEIFVMLTRTTIIVVFLNTYPTLVTIAIAHFSMTIVGYIFTVIAARKLADISHLKLFRIPDRETVKTILAFSVITLVISTIGRIIAYIDLPLIAALISVQAVTYYTIGSRLIKYLSNLVQVLNHVLAPATSDLCARDNLDTIRNLFFYSSKIISLVVFSVVFFLFFFGDSFLVLWLGKEYPESYQVMCVLGIASLLYLPQYNTTPILLGTARHKVLMYLALASGFVSVLAAVVLGKYYHLIGIAIGLSVPQGLLYGIVCPVYVSRLININYWQWLFSTYIKVWIPTVPFVLFLFACKMTFTIDTWFSFIVIGFLSCCIYYLIAWIFVINKDEKRIIHEKITGIINR